MFKSLLMAILFCIVPMQAWRICSERGAVQVYSDELYMRITFGRGATVKYCAKLCSLQLRLDDTRSGRADVNSTGIGGVDRVLRGHSYLVHDLKMRGFKSSWITLKFSLEAASEEAFSFEKLGRALDGVLSEEGRRVAKIEFFEGDPEVGCFDKSCVIL